MSPIEAVSDQVAFKMVLLYAFQCAEDDPVRRVSRGVGARGEVIPKSVLKVIETLRPVVTQVAIGSVIPAKAGIQKK